MAKFNVELHSVGNPDHGQNPFRFLDGVESKVIQVNTIEEAQAAVREYIAKHHLGSGNWAGGKVWNMNGVQVGYISYNGRFWEGTEK